MHDPADIAGLVRPQDVGHFMLGLSAEQILNVAHRRNQALLVFQ